MSQLHDPEVTLSNFQKLMKETNNNPNATQLREFIKENFSAEAELENWSPTDWTKSPKILNRIQDPNFREWLEDLNLIWKKLSRKVKKEVSENPSRHSLIYVENGFIAPGGRFTEYYYWDSYWIIEGLLLSDMHQTAKGMILNFLYLVKTYGFIPNGGRVYYLMRSQPPLLIPMVDRYLEYTNDHRFLYEIIGILEKEFAYWQRDHAIEVEKNGVTYKMSRYIVSSDGPRPESYSEDYVLAQGKSEDERNSYYEDIKAAAESGWDFSARWFITSNGAKGNLTNMATRYIIPVDLNAFLQKNARLLSEFQLKLGNIAKSRYYEDIAKEYQVAIDNVLWNEEKGIWLDYDIKNKKQRDIFYPTNLTPLYTKSYDISRSREYADKMVNYLNSIGIIDYMGGTPTSLDPTGEQWDYPNAWPPLQSIIVKGLHETGWEPATSLAKELATRWLRANHAGFLTYGQMCEKYDAVKPGECGGGGEYQVQAGFGWTNGVVFELLDLYSSVTSTDSETIVACKDCVDR
ncbi:trehalase isoform X2 [Cephus cinctus]|nr:trehalase isoform X2 [Cephus cinctus]